MDCLKGMVKIVSFSSFKQMWSLLVFNMRYPIIKLIANEFDNTFEMFKYIFSILYLYDLLYILFIHLFSYYFWTISNNEKNKTKFKIIKSKATTCKSISYDFQNPLYYTKNDNNKPQTILKIRKMEYKLKKKATRTSLIIEVGWGA